MALLGLKFNSGSKIRAKKALAVQKVALDELELARKLIRKCLQLKKTDPLPRESMLLGGYPEFNSLTIAILIIDIEEALDCEIADDELSGEIFETVGSLADFIKQIMVYE